jgi:hypothetical protein
MGAKTYAARRKISAESNSRANHDDWTIITWLGDGTHTRYEVKRTENTPRDLHRKDYWSFKIKKSALNTLVIV